MLHSRPHPCRSALCWSVVLCSVLFGTVLLRTVCGAQPPPGPLGSSEKIRFAWQQWRHFKIPREELLKRLAGVGTTVFAPDRGSSAEEAQATHRHGLLYFGTNYCVRDWPKLPQAVDKFGLTCPEQFEAYKAAGGNVNEPWGKYGEGKPAYIPCVLQPQPLIATFIEPALEGVRKGWLDGLFVDYESYGAYAFGKYGDMTCYCDHCFGEYRRHKKLDGKAAVAKSERYGWLRGRALLDDYLEFLGGRVAEILQGEANRRVWSINPRFRFAIYPTPTSDPRRDWRLTAFVKGLNSPRAPAIVVNEFPYWQNPDQPWWESQHAWYRKLGVQYVQGSYHATLMGGHPYSEVSQDRLMYELAMGSDGFWRWGERAYDHFEWNGLMLAHQRLRQVEARIGPLLLAGRELSHFVTVVELTGDPDLWRNLVTRTYHHHGRYLTRVFNGNTDWPLRLRLRFPRVPRLPQGQAWRIRDPLHEVDYLPAEGAGDWDSAALAAGLVVAIPGRGELFLMIEPAKTGRTIDRFRSIRSFEIPTLEPRPADTDPLPEKIEPIPPDHIAFLGGRSGSLELIGGTRGTPRRLFSSQFVRQPDLSGDRRLLAVAAWHNGRAQIYLVAADGSAAVNLSNNHYNEHSPRFSPDGRRIAFVSDCHADGEIYSMDLDGSGRRRLTDSPGVDRSPAYSPDGRQIAFISDRDGDLDVLLMDVDGGRPRSLFPRAGNQYEPVFSPDGRTVAGTAMVRHLRCIQVSRTDGSDSHYLACGPATDLRCIRFSPDGRKVAAAFRNFGQSGILVADVEAAVDPQFEDWKAQKVRILVSDKARDARAGSWHTTGQNSPRSVCTIFTGVSFSPDGRRLVYCSDRSEDRRFRLYTVPVDGGESVPVPGAEPGWPSHIVWAAGH